jgi:hypothetical protein
MKFFPRRLFSVLCIAFSVFAASGRAYADSIELAWKAHSDPAVTGYILYVGTQSGVYSQSFDVGNVTSFVYPSAVAGQLYYFAVAAYLPGAVVGAKSGEVTGMSNQPPTLANPGAQSTTVGQSTSLQLAGKDPEGMPITYGASGLPPGMLLTTSTGSISGTPTTAGTFAVTATASDGVLVTTTTFTWTVAAAALTAPTLVSPMGTTVTPTPTFVWNAAQGAASYVLYADDSVTTGKIRVTMSAAAAGCAASNVCSATPGIALASGSAYWAVKAQAASGTGAWSDLVQFTVAGVPPTLSITSPAGTSYETLGATLALTGTASDSDGIATVTWTNSRGGSGTASGTNAWSAAVPLQPGFNTITVTARDGSGSTTTASMTAILVARPSPVGPGGITTGSPTFTWTPVPGASKYVLKVTDSSQAVKVNQTVTPDLTACASSGATVCSFTPSVALAAGNGSWSVEAIALTDIGAWSASMAFVVDLAPPSLAISSPTTASSYGTSTSSIILTGTSNDDTGVVKVAWTTDRGDSGIATGTKQWSTAAITLASGTTSITVTATDTAGRVGSSVLNVTYTPALTLTPAPAGCTSVSALPHAQMRASASVDPLDAQAVLDGQPSTKWQASPLSSPQGIILSLGGQYVVCGVQYAPESWTSVDHYAVYVSNDGATWGSPVAQGSISATGGKITFAGVTASYVRFVVIDGVGGQSYAYVSDLDVIASAQPAVTCGSAAVLPHAQMRVASASVDALDASSVLDGQAGTKWLASPLNSPQGIALGLGGQYLVCGVKYAPESWTSVDHYAVYVSTDGANWGTPVAQGSISATGGNITLAGVTGSYVRFVVIDGAGGQNYAYVSDLDVVGAQ